MVQCKTVSQRLTGDVRPLDVCWTMLEAGCVSVDLEAWHGIALEGFKFEWPTLLMPLVYSASFSAAIG